MKKPLISIIIPAYNAEKCIARMLDSVLAQSFTDFELILVDDGSTDSTRTIIEKYTNQDSRVRAIFISHRGVSAARNAALALDLCEYILFADADDYVDPEWVQCFVDNIGEYDACEQMIRIIDEFGNENLVGHGKFKVLNEKEKADYIVNIEGYLSRYLLKRDIIERNHLRFVETVSLAEDLLFYLEYVIKSQSIISIDSAHYNYYQSNTLFQMRYKGKFFESLPYFLEILYREYGGGMS
jgi:glycosyltransferase involved in cell wall biosynthesis